MKPYIISVKNPVDPKDGGFGVGRPTFGAWIVAADNEQDARDAVEEIILDGFKVDDCLGVAPADVAANYALVHGVPEHFNERP